MTKDLSPLLTVIIPTLNRIDTLYWTIKTVIAQEYKNLKIIISDNCSEDNIKELLQNFTDERISYTKTPQRFTMMQHFEYILNYADKGYISILGSDDGFLPGSIDKVVHIINKYPDILAIGWRFGNYNWPGLPAFFMIPMANYYRVVNATSEIEKVFKKNIYQTICFPSLYGGFISVELIKQLKQKNDGVFFHSRIPDFFSGAFVAANVEKYIRLEFPVTLNATSKSSAGFATTRSNVDQRSFNDLLTDEGNAPFHPSLKFIRCNVVPIAEALLQVNRLVPSFPKVAIKKVLNEVMLELRQEEDRNKIAEMKDGLIEMGKRNGMEDYVNDMLAKLVHVSPSSAVKKKFSPLSSTLYMYTTETSIQNVEDACNFAAEVIPKEFVELKIAFLKNYFRFQSSCRYLYLKWFSGKRKYI
ncbi:MAG: glycosyltransferase family 2 protein [Ferruginibacter sp.]|nr:glycosyltransferase family 2 protein [Ferruginibacter sp.]